MELLRYFVVSRCNKNGGIKVCDLKQGVHYNFDEKKKDTFQDDKRNVRATWWHKNGHPYEDDYWVDGRAHGLQRHWYENGQLRYEETYKNGKRHSLVVIGIKMNGWNTNIT